jgi:beta-lactamase superfamily II metal-dependent hydrolase
MTSPELDFSASFITVHCLWCDQGMAHVLEVRGPDFQPAGLAVFDFGVELLKKNSVLRELQAAPAVAKLMSLLRALPQPRIEYFVVSHQDTDHWGLVPYFLEAVAAENMQLTIGKVIYGGQGWKPGALKQINALGRYTANQVTDVVRQGKTYSDFLQDPPGELGRIGDVHIQSLVVNAPTPLHRSGPMFLNGTSLVASIKFQGRHFVLPGDATWETLVYANTVLKPWPASPVAPTELLSVPHHGSLETLSDRVPHDTSAFAIVAEFVNYCPADSTVASAGSVNGYSHPYKEVIEAFSERVGEGGFFTPLVNEHSYVAFDKPTKSWQYSPLTRRNIYTTVLSIGTNPIWVANWAFLLDSGGTSVTTFEPFEGATRATMDDDPMDTAEQYWWAERSGDPFDDDQLGDFIAQAERDLPPHLFARLSDGVKLFSYRLAGRPEVVRPMPRRAGRPETSPVKRVRARRGPPDLEG